MVKGVQKVLKPVEGILSRILKFIGTILIGKVLKKKLLIRTKSAKGLVKEFSIDPTWLRLKVCYYNNSGYLSVISKGRSIEIGKFLNVIELKKLAKVIKKALIKRESEIFSS